MWNGKAITRLRNERIERERERVDKCRKNCINVKMYRTLSKIDSPDGCVWIYEGRQRDCELWNRVFVVFTNIEWTKDVILVGVTLLFVGENHQNDLWISHVLLNTKMIPYDETLQ